MMGKQLLVRWQCTKCDVLGKAPVMGIGKRPVCWNCGSTKHVKIL